MSLVEMLQNQTKVLRAREVAKLFEVTPQHIYKMAASGRIPFFRVAGAIRFDPQELATWLRTVRRFTPMASGRWQGRLPNDHLAETQPKCNRWRENWWCCVCQPAC